MMAGYILLEPIPVAFLVRDIVLNTAFKQPILAGVVVPANLLGIVGWVGVCCCGLLGHFCGFGRFVEFLVAGVVFVRALGVGHGSLSLMEWKCEQ